MNALQTGDERHVIAKSMAEIEAMRKAGRILRGIRDELREKVCPGLTTLELDELFARRARQAKVISAFHGLYGFPGHICASVNEEVVHGIPSAQRTLREGDIVSLDMGIVVDGLYSDTAVTVAVGEVDEEKRRLLEITELALEDAITQCRPGKRIGDIGAAAQKRAEQAGFSVVREYTGHGIGRSLHEAPKVPNFGRAGTGPRLCEGWVLAIEPMINAGHWRTRTRQDNWTVVAADGRPSAHFEHTVAIMADGPLVLT